MRTFLYKLSELIRLGDTRTLEFVIGLIAITLGSQLLAGLLGLLPLSPLLIDLPVLWVFLLTTGMVVGGIFKVVGAVLGHEMFRIIASMGLSACWLYVTVLYFSTATPFTLVLFLILALQSAWVYIRLSLLRKQRQDHVQ